MQCAKPALIAETPVSDPGTVVWPSEFEPQQTTVPEVRSAMENSPPASTDEAEPSVPGTVHWPEVLDPQHTTLPLDFLAIECSAPPLTCTTSERPTGGPD